MRASIVMVVVAGLSVYALAGSVLNAHRRFAVAAFTPVLLNVVIIAFAGWVGPRIDRPELGLAIGVFAAGIVQLAFQLLTGALSLNSKCLVSFKTQQRELHTTLRQFAQIRQHLRLA